MDDVEKDLLFPPNGSPHALSPRSKIFITLLRAGYCVQTFTGSHYRVRTSVWSFSLDFSSSMYTSTHFGTEWSKCPHDKYVLKRMTILTQILRILPNKAKSLFKFTIHFRFDSVWLNTNSS